MARWSTQRILNDTSLFDSRQLQPRAVLTCCMRMWAQWTSEHLLPFPRLVRDLGFGVVVVRIGIRYERPFTFFSADDFVARATLSVRQKRHLLFGEVQLFNGEERFLSLQSAMRPVALESGSDFGALPARVDGRVLEMFRTDEISDEAVDRPVRKALSNVSRDSPVALGRRSLRMSRHDSEVADQWSFIEVGANAATAREEMILDADGAQRERLAAGLTAPLTSIDIEIGRPLFLFDTAEIETSAHAGADGLTFVHVYKSRVGGSHEHATVVERFAS